MSRNIQNQLQPRQLKTRRPVMPEDRCSSKVQSVLAKGLCEELAYKCAHALTVAIMVLTIGDGPFFCTR